MRLVLEHPDWRPENLPRIRDLVEQSMARLRATMQGSEESWVMNPVLAYWKQSNPLYLTTSAFLDPRLQCRPAALDAQGRWRKRTAMPSPCESANLRGSANDRAQMTALLDRLKQESGVMKDVATDLAQLLPDIPDASLQADWRSLCAQIAGDLLVTPEKTLARLDALRLSLLAAGDARVWMVGSRANLDQLQPPLLALTDDLRAAKPPAAHYDAARRIDQRLRDHQGDAAHRDSSASTIPTWPVA